MEGIAGSKDGLIPVTGTPSRVFKPGQPLEVDFIDNRLSSVQPAWKDLGAQCGTDVVKFVEDEPEPEPLPEIERTVEMSKQMEEFQRAVTEFERRQRKRDKRAFVGLSMTEKRPIQAG
jgi:hypothetical protein